MIRQVSHDICTNLAWNLPVKNDSVGNYRDGLFFTQQIYVEKIPTLASKVVVPISATMD